MSARLSKKAKEKQFWWNDVMQQFEYFEMTGVNRAAIMQWLNKVLTNANEGSRDAAKAILSSIAKETPDE